MNSREIRYITVHTPHGDIYGGNQNLFSKRIIQKFGCGLIAAADVSLWLSSENEMLSLEEYTKYVEKIRKYFLIFPELGMNGWALAIGLNHIFRKDKMPFRAHWKMMPVGKNSRDHMEKMLQEGIPVILAAGPNFPNIFKKEKLTLYSKITDNNYKKTGSMLKHFVTVTGMSEDGMMRISSWGKCFYISYDEWRDYARKKSMPLLTNYLSIRRLKRS